MKRALPWLAVFAVGLVADAAHADSTNSLATTAFREGRDALKQGDYELACAKFRTSDDAEPSSGARLNLGDCALRRSRYVEAEQLYRAAALLTDGDKRVFAEQRAAVARAMAGTLRLRWAAGSPASGRVDIDGQTFEVPGDLHVNPGRHFIRVFAPGFSDAPQSVDVASGGTAQVELSATLVTVSSPAAARPPERRAPEATAARRTSRSPFSYVLLGAGGAAVGAGVVSLLVSRGAEGDVAAKCNDRKPCAPDIWARADVQDDVDRTKRWAAVSAVCFIGGAISIAAGGTVWLMTAPARGGQTVSVVGVF